jgi:hypothetical protein
MKTSKGTILVLSLAALASFYGNAYCCSRWDVFLREPDKDALVVLENTVIASEQRCSQDVAPAQKQRSKLFELIREGNPSAFRAALLVSKCWDGGEVEDFYRSVGVFFEAQPRAFLQIAKEKTIPDSQLRYFLIMLPLDTVDNIDHKISVVENRIAVLKGCSDKSFSEIKKRGLFFLEKEKENLDKIKIEMYKTK